MGQPQVTLYKKETNVIQIVEHNQNFEKIGVRCPVYYGKRVLFLKNLSGFLTLQFHNTVDLFKFEKQEVYGPGLYLSQLVKNFKQNVKNFQSEDYQHFADEVQFQFL